MPNKKQTSKSVARVASKILRSNSAKRSCKKVAGSALSQTRKNNF